MKSKVLGLIAVIMTSFSAKAALPSQMTCQFFMEDKVLSQNISTDGGHYSSENDPNSVLQGTRFALHFDTTRVDAAGQELQSSRLILRDTLTRVAAYADAGRFTVEPVKAIGVELQEDAARIYVVINCDVK